ncbi:cyclic AMP-responsive element-binding protein 3-like protein 1 [Strongylocentrotus purpuratus]|uniref:BZIP domain-containing protein n=1 Tax=Strongylocentrotus purpuratus TaxID=7668 RepID=A0A7M7NZB8_STRPU|nr:cyclic AMP-responsive element-binding protein 3-like protein 1 [Strongylocentrotus purpuratus]
MTDHLDGLSSPSYYEYDYLFDDDPLLSADKMVSGDASDPTLPHIASEHSYSMMSEPNSPMMKDIKQEDDLDSNYDPEGLQDMLPVSPETDDHHISLISSDQHNNTTTTTTAGGLTTGYLLMDKLTGAKSILTTANRTSLTRNGELKPTTTTLQQKQDGSKIKLELVTMMNVDNGLGSKHQMPPTPPGSTASYSDSDGSESPGRSTPSSPRAVPIQPAKRPICHTRTVSPQLFTNIQKLPQSGPLHLTEEERRTLRQEGYPIPTKLPLTKAEEKSLKKVRRKIKNKISAQESRRKKKEYLEALEKRMDSYTSENTELKRKVENLENTNQSLSSQLSKLQSIVNKISKPIKAHTTQTGTCLMVLVLCFAVFLGSWTPHSFLSSNQHLPKLFSSSSSPNNDMPHPFFGPYGNNIQYSAPSFHGDDGEDQPDPIFRMYGPKPASGSEDDDPYTTHSMRSSRTLLSYQDEEDAFAGIDPHYHDDSHALLDNIAPEAPSFAKMAAALMTGLGSEVAGVESEETGYEAYMMHPDMEAKIIPVDTMALINRSSNK